MKAAVDRIENKTAVLLFESHKVHVNVPMVLLPEGIKEGDWLTINIGLDRNKTSDMYLKNKILLEKLKNK